MKVRFKRLDPEAAAPVRGSEHSAAWDLCATRVVKELDTPDGMPRVTVHTGLAVEIPEGWYGDLRARSSVCHTGLILANGCGVIDSDYRGEIKAVFYMPTGNNMPTGNHLCNYSEGERCLQLLISPVPDVEFEEADELPPTTRGAGGYGSTGR